MIGIKEYNKKIVSLKNTKKMTKTMKMVSASKFKRAYKSQSNALLFSGELAGLMGRLGIPEEENEHPLMKKSKAIENVLVLLLTSDKGLCGGFNNNLLRFMRGWLRQNETVYKFIDFSFCGRRGFNAFRKVVSVNTYYEDATLRPQFATAVKIGADLSEAFSKKQYDRILIAYNHFKNPLAQVPTIEQLLPFDPSMIIDNSKKTGHTEYLFDPQATDIFKLLIPKYLNFKIYFSLLENAAGEHGARMTAMDKATENTGELIDKYVLLRNRARQSAITTELIEIISGAEALNV